MTSIDDIFKVYPRYYFTILPSAAILTCPLQKPAVVGSGSAKRKLEPVKDPSTHPPHAIYTIAQLADVNEIIDELYKAAKLETNGDVKSKGKAPAVEDEGEEESEFAGPELPPDFDQEDVPDDEEGRFFGGGMARQTAQAMEYLDQQEKERGEVAVSGHYIA